MCISLPMAISFGIHEVNRRYLMPNDLFYCTFPYCIPPFI
jgi:hypothetical protein